VGVSYAIVGVAYAIVGVVYAVLGGACMLVWSSLYCNIVNKCFEILLCICSYK